MTFVRANPPGWALFELLTSAQMNIIDSQMPYALDGQAGGAYAPTGGLVLDGSSIANPNFLLDLTAGPGGAIHIDAADPAADVSGIHIECTDNTEGMRIQPVGNRNQGLNPQDMLTVIGHTNDGGGGGAAILAFGGAASTFGAGGVLGVGGQGGATGGGGTGITGFGGDATANPQGGGAGVYGAGGEPRGSSSLFSGAGVYGQGGSTATGSQAGRGVVGIGGSSGTPAISGAGGYFQGTDSGPGLEAHADAGNLGYGVDATGDSAAVRGLGVSGGFGGVFGGDDTAPGISVVPGANTNAAAYISGSIDFDFASSTKKNPAANVVINNELFAKGIIKAWGYVEDGVLIEGYNVDSVAIQATTNTLNVIMPGPMASTNYFVVTASSDGWGSNTPRLITYNKETPVIVGSNQNRSTVLFQLRQYGHISGNAVNMNDSEFGFIVMGVHA